MIVKVWEAYLQQKQLQFYIDQQRTEPAIFGGNEQMSLQFYSALLVDSTNNLYLTQDGYSLSIVDEVNCVNHTQNAGINGATSSIQDAIEKINLWNVTQQHKITKHRIIFPYQIQMNHWCLGVLELNFSNNQLINANLKIYEPLNDRANLAPQQIAQFQSVIQQFNAAISLSSQVSFTAQQADGSSCGAITAENGKDIIDGVTNKIQQKYPAGAKDLRQHHIDEVGNPKFEQNQEEEIFNRGDKTTRQGLTRQLIDNLVGLENTHKENLTRALKAFQLDYQKMAQSNVINPFAELKKFFNISFAPDKILTRNNKDILEPLFNYLFKDNAMTWHDGAIDELANALGSILRALAKKQASNTFSTGGGGENYEAKVRAYYIAMLLTQEYFPPVNWSKIYQIHIQAREKDYQTDDLVVLSETKTKARRLLIQVKHAIKFMPSNGALAESITQFWIDYHNPIKFNPTTDAFSLIFAEADERLDDINEQLRQIRTVADLKEFQIKRKIHSKEINVIELVKAIIQKIEPGVSDIAIFEFLKNVYLLDLDFDNKKELTAIFNNLQRATADQTDVKQLWASIINAGSEYALTAGTVTLKNLPEDIKNKFQTATTHSTSNIDNFGREHFPATPMVTRSTKAKVDKISAILETNDTIVIHGIRGAGKTYLGLLAAAAVPSTYRVYFDASSSTKLISTYTQLAAELNLPIANYTGSTVEQKVTHALSQRNGGLLFFDDATGYATVKKLMPGNTKHIITTSNKSFTRYHIPTIEITKMSAEEAQELVTLRLSTQDIIATPESTAQLCSLVDCLPLALVQACGYILYNDCSVENYCTIYEEHTKKALDGSLQDPEDFAEHTAVYYTWDVSFQQLNTFTRQILIELAYLNFNNISRQFIKWFWPGEEPVSASERAINDLVNYCLVTRTQTDILLHSVLKDVIIQQNIANALHEQTITELLRKFQTCFIYHRSLSKNDLAGLSLAIPHLSTLIKHAKKIKLDLLPYQDLISHIVNFYIDALDDAKEADDYLKIIKDQDNYDANFNYLQAKVKLRRGKAAEAYQYFNAYLTSVNFTLDDLGIYELCTFANILMRFMPTTPYPRIDFVLNHLAQQASQSEPNSDSSVDTSLSQIPSQQQRQNNINEVETILTSALQQTSENSPEQAMVLHYFGNYYLMTLRQSEKALKYYQQALELKKSADPDNEREIARTHHQLGLCLLSLNDLNNALSHFQHAYDIRKLHRFSNETLASLRNIVRIRQKQYRNHKDNAILLDIKNTLIDIKNIKESLNLNLNDTFYWLIYICLKLDRKEEAKEYLKIISKKSKTLNKKLQELKAIVETQDIRMYSGQIDRLINNLDIIRTDVSVDDDDSRSNTAFDHEISSPTLPRITEKRAHEDEADEDFNENNGEASDSMTADRTTPGLFQSPKKPRLSSTDDNAIASEPESEDDEKSPTTTYTTSPSPMS